MREIPGRSLPALAATLNLPPLAVGHVPYWREDVVRHPASILEHLDRTTPLWGKALGPEPVASAPEVEIVPLDEDVTAA
ncbi:hypothetical protein [Methylobacterium aquaticum]|uniref:hypothetical protein n=1 Tax=Methylobacterium aquaticum TaxID=270351 RepID=UPI001932BB33|nr:hypothetical protein [Methylobacterium aquaticum]QRE78260.1 hypothetical protein F1D61_33075 [Methylobacterium aquaticum]